MTQEEHAEELHLRYKVAEKTKQYARLLDYQMREVRLSWGKF